MPRRKAADEPRWACTVTTSEDGEWRFLNVHPLYGREHWMLPECWCEPEVIADNGHEVGLQHRSEH